MAYTLKSDWIPESKYATKSPYMMTPKGIVVHNTATTASAEAEVWP